MKIVDVKSTIVNVHMKEPICFALGVIHGTTRTIIEISTNTGLVGLGETTGSLSKQIIDHTIKPLILGRDPFELEAIRNVCRWNMADNVLGMRSLAGIEMGLLDLMGKELNKSVSDLIGGKCRKAVPFAAYIFPKLDYLNRSEQSVPESMADLCNDAIGLYGFDTLELKLGVFPPKLDVEVVRTVRESIGDNISIRVDANESWSSATAVQTIRSLEEYGVSNVEEPVRGLGALARVRRLVKTPISTHSPMIAEISRLHAADAIVSDVQDSGGISMTKRIAAAAELFNYNFWLHSSCELGISTAAYLHLAASTPHMIFPNQSHYHHQVDDVIAHRFKYERGAIKVPEGPGLGVSLDEEKLNQYSRLYQSEGELGFYTCPYADSNVPLYSRF